MESSCPDEAALAAFLARTITGGAGEVHDAHDAIGAHLDTCAACRETIAHVAATEPHQLGRYRLDRVIGSGGMGIVWEAWDPALERGLAIKVLRPDASDAAGGARLVREARALAKLQHPNVIAIHDVGELAGEVFIATELIDGQAMDRWQRDRPPADVIAAYAQAARGLAAAHAHGFVHRDVKPANILVGRDGRVRIGDFGLAVRDAAADPVPVVAGGGHDARVTRAGAVAGTPAYMAPEQRAGAPVDARADQYSLCLALAEALLGERPAPGTGAAQLAARGVVAPWAAIARGLATDRADRYPELGPLIAALDGGHRRARRWWLALAGAAATTGVAATMLVRAAPPDPAAACVGRRPLAGRWEPATRRALGDALTASKLPYAPDAARAAIQAIDGWASELDGEARRACEDAATRRQPPDVVAKRRACLDRARDQLVELLAVLQPTPDASAVQRAPASARALPRPSACNTDAGLAGEIIAPTWRPRRSCRGCRRGSPRRSRCAASASCPPPARSPRPCSPTPARSARCRRSPTRSRSSGRSSTPPTILPRSRHSRTRSPWRPAPTPTHAPPRSRPCSSRSSAAAAMSMRRSARRGSRGHRSSAPATIATSRRWSSAGWAAPTRAPRAISRRTSTTGRPRRSTRRSAQPTTSTSIAAPR